MMLADYKAGELDVCTKYSLTAKRAFRRWTIKHYAEDPAHKDKLSSSPTEVNRIWPVSCNGF